MINLSAALILLFLAQSVSSFLSTATLHAALRKSTLRFASTAALSDVVKLSVYTSVAVLAVKGSWMGIIAAVLGGVVGNTAAHIKRHGFSIKD